MNSLYETIKKYSSGKGEDMMWKSVELISRAVDENMPEKERELLIADVYGLMSGNHYNEEYAQRCVAKMYYTDKTGAKHYAPYWTVEQVRRIYDEVKEDIPNYNEWDFYVTFNMIASDNWVLLHEWWPDITPELFARKVTELAVSWLSDVDWNCSDSKIWDYMHMK